MLWRSALRADSPAVLGPGAGRITHYARVARCVQTRCGQHVVEACCARRPEPCALWRPRNRQPRLAACRSTGRVCIPGKDDASPLPHRTPNIHKAAVHQRQQCAETRHRASAVRDFTALTPPAPWRAGAAARNRGRPGHADCMRPLDVLIESVSMSLYRIVRTFPTEFIIAPAVVRSLGLN